MKVGKSYTLAAFLVWTGRKTYVLLALALLAVLLYEVAGQQWVAAP